MQDQRFEGLGPDEQWQAWDAEVTDPRPRIATGFSELDALLKRQSMAPGTFVIHGGRPHTRKTAIMANVIVNMLRADVPVGLVGLDEATPTYVAKVASAMSGVDEDHLEEHWSALDDVRADYLELTKQLSLTRGYRPTFEELEGWLATSEVAGARPRIVFIDHLNLLFRDKYAGADNQRVPRVAEALQVWAKQQEVVVYALHHVGRADDYKRRYHGATPMTLESLKYGGEEFADIVLGTFRPAMDPVGNMTEDQARSALGDSFDLDDWQDARDRVEAHRDSTFVQLLKNRPGKQLCPQGIHLKSIGTSQQMRQSSDLVGDDMRRAS